MNAHTGKDSNMSENGEQLSLPEESIKLFLTCLERNGIPYVIVNHSRPVISTQDKITLLNLGYEELIRKLLEKGIRPFFTESGIVFTATRTVTASFNYQERDFPFLVTTL